MVEVTTYFATYSEDLASYYKEPKSLFLSFSLYCQ